MKLLEDKVTLVTGGGRGIGRAIVLKFAEQGSDIAFTYLTMKEEAEQVAEQVRALGRRALCICSDASSYDEAENVVKQVLSEFGRIDVLVNNAGTAKDGLILRMDENQWDGIINANLKSAFNYSKHVSQSMIRRKQGSIINMSSVVGVAGNAGQCNYAASKAGMIGMTKALAKELGGRNVRVNAISAGFIRTDMTAPLPEEIKQDYISDIALKRMGEPEEVANAALFLASDMSSYISGDVLNVSGLMKG